MPISADQYTDCDTQRYTLPMDSCVGDDGPTPEEAAAISRPGTKTSGSNGYQTKGGPPPTAADFDGRGHTGAPQRGNEFRVVDAGPLGCAGGDYDRNLGSREA